MREQGSAGLYMFGISYAYYMYTRCVGCGVIKLFVRQRVGTRAGQANEVRGGGAEGIRRRGRYDMACACYSMFM